MIGDYLTGIVLDWRTWVAMAVLVFVPGLLLRIFLLVFPRHDPRRQELLAEMYAVPVCRRPLWVIAQIEVIVWEGFPERWYQFAIGRIIDRWKLGSGVKSHAAHPDTFWLPAEKERIAVPPGMHVKLMFQMREGWGERMWVTVEKRTWRGRYTGTLNNVPVGIPRLNPGDRVRFSPEHIIDIVPPNEPCECCECGTEEQGGWTLYCANHGEPMVIDEGGPGQNPGVGG